MIISIISAINIIVWGVWSLVRIPSPRLGESIDNQKIVDAFSFYTHRKMRSVDAVVYAKIQPRSQSKTLWTLVLLSVLAVFCWCAIKPIKPSEYVCAYSLKTLWDLLGGSVKENGRHSARRSV